LLAEEPRGAPVHYDPDESRRRLKAKQAPVPEVKSMDPIEPLDDEIAPEPVDDDANDGL
jgi:hypothetical protein